MSKPVAPHEQERRLGKVPRQVERSLKLTRLSLISEALLAAFWPAITLVFALLALALSGLLERLDGWLHLAVLVVLAIGLCALLWRGLRRLTWPKREEIRHRTEAASHLPNRPLSGYLDKSVATSDDPVAVALYRRHRTRMHALLSQLRPAGPRPVLAARDRYALLPVAALLFLVALVGAGGDAWNRLTAAVIPGLQAAPVQPMSLEAWVDPPDYTDLAPIYLSASNGQAVELPAGSRLIAQVEGIDAAPVLRLDLTDTAFETLAPGLHRLEDTIEGGERLAIVEGERELAAWPITVLPDQAPSVGFTGEVAESDRKALMVPFLAEDDYGLETVTAHLNLTEGGTGEALTYILAAPEGSSARVEGENYQDLTAHPWAGLPADLTLVAVDGRGQQGSSKPLPIVIPERVFSHPIAKQLIVLRRHLTVAPKVRDPIVQALDQILDAPEAFGHDLVAALAMIGAASRLDKDESQDAVTAAQILLWEAALRMEEGDVSLLVQELRDIQKRLQEALDNGASEEEIEALLDELEEAMQRYLQAMAEEMQRRMERGEMPEIPENSQFVPDESLQQMMQELRDLNKAGARDLARQRLEQLQRLLENLQAAPYGQPDPSAAETLEQMRALEGMLRRQQELLDESYRAQQQGEGQQPGQQEGEQQGQGQGNRPLSGNAPAQDQLRRELGQMMRDLAQQLGEVPQHLGRAEQAMRRATDALEGEDAPGAAGAQGEALEQMRQGLSDLAQRMSPQMGPPQDGQGMAPTGNRRENSQDPLGREAGQGRIDSRENIGIPDAGELTRAREILEELRERRDDQFRPAQERDYIERLLDFF